MKQKPAVAFKHRKRQAKCFALVLRRIRQPFDNGKEGYGQIYLFFMTSTAAPIKPSNRGWGLLGLDLNSG